MRRKCPWWGQQGKKRKGIKQTGLAPSMCLVLPKGSDNAALTPQCSSVLYTDVTWMEIMSFLTHFKQPIVHLHVAITTNKSKALHNVTVDALESTQHSAIKILIWGNVKDTKK